MPLVIFRGADDSVMTAEFPVELTLGTDLWAACPPPGVEQRHAVVTCSRTQFPVLIDLAPMGWATRVNGVDACGVRVLRHGDRIQLGSAELVYWEILLQRARPEHIGPPDRGRTCPLCTRKIAVDAEVVVCPRCKVLQHKRCWFSLKQCPYYACQYPVQQALRDTLCPPLRFEDLETGSALVRDQGCCAAGTRRDEVPFQDGDVVVFCPGCERPFHAACWLVCGRCPTQGCGYGIETLLRHAFTPGEDEARGPVSRRR